MPLDIGQRHDEVDPATLQILQTPNAILNTVCRPVERVGKEFYAVVEAMRALLVPRLGLGLAAPQVGITERFFLAKLDGGDEHTLLINPVIKSLKGRARESEEGCLSIRGWKAHVMRFPKVVIEYYDAGGKKVVRNLNDLPARIAQHEYDHLDGVLITDRSKHLIPFTVDEAIIERAAR